MKLKQSKNQFKWYHFPKGSIVIIEHSEINNGVPFQVEVVDLIMSGPGIYVIHVVDDDLTIRSYNICHVAKIVKRGPGVAVTNKVQNWIYSDKKEMPTMSAFYRDMLYHQHSVNVQKNKTYGFTFASIIQQHLPELPVHTSLNYTKLENYLMDSGVVKMIDTGKPVDPYYYTGQTKKIKKKIKQVYTKCLISFDRWYKEVYRPTLEEDAERDYENVWTKD